MKILVFITFMFVLSFPAYSSKQYYDLTISELSLGWAGEGVYVRVSDSIEISDSCEIPSFLMLPDSPLFEANYSMLLAAYMSGKKVGLYVSGCQGKSMSLKAVRMRK